MFVLVFVVVGFMFVFGGGGFWFLGWDLNLLFLSNFDFWGFIFFVF